jgi:hypothetical protein
MPLITGTPAGTITSQTDLYWEGAPNIWYQNFAANELFNPDSDGFYWGLSATVAQPVWELGCLDTVVLSENLTMNDVICESSGYKATVRRRNYLEFSFNLATLLPLSTINELLSAGAVTVSGGVAKMGIGVIDNTKFFHVYAAKVYDESVGDYIAFTLHKCQFVDAWSLNMTYGANWKLTGVKARAFANTLLPTAQQFATVINLDPSVNP